MTTLNTNQSRWWPASRPVEGRVTGLFRFVALMAAITWLAASGWVVMHTATVGSPDEAANRLFIHHVATDGTYAIPIGLSPAETNLFHPRSTMPSGSSIIPGSFLGLVQLGGLVAQLGGLGAERLLTPILAGLALWALFNVFRRFWGRWWSLLAVTLLAVHPVFVEFMTLPYLHNGAFAALLAIAGWALLRHLEQRSVQRAVTFGLLYGAALMFRPIEVIWTGPIVAIMLIAWRDWWNLAIAGLAAIAVQLPWLIANHQLYGSWLSTGYAPAGLFTAGSDTDTTSSSLQLFTPAGGHWNWHWLSSTWWYLIALVPTWSVAAVVSLVRYFRRKFTTVGKAVKLTGIGLLAVVPLVYYGSWDLYPQTPASTIGALASYARYWLPLYMAMVAGVILLLRTITTRWLLGVVAVALFASQVMTVVIHPVSGIQARFSSDERGRARRDFVVNSTPTDSLIIAGHQDTYLYDVRLTTFALPQSAADWQTLRTVVQHRPTYIYLAPGQFDQSSLEQQLADHELRVGQKHISGRDSL
ncbi:MAG: glycosyltransferase family 39 protein, partial [Candidatus Kerfeldbacteria bacterium]|nr:glycosyltransferase family 39 protein [Candidatus Kerfeldbacteria bacterium]